MNTPTLALLGALALGPALGGCQTETPTDDTTATVVNDDSLDGAIDLTDSLDADAQDALDGAGSAARDAGTAIGTAADSVGAAAGRAADRAEDVIDSNVDVGENAENQGDR